MEVIIDMGQPHEEGAGELLQRIARLHASGARRVEFPPSGPIVIEWGEVDIAAELGGVPW